jgi:U32 family peptidase
MTIAPTDLLLEKTSQPLPALPELLAPAGDFASLRAAIGNGADAVYLGAGSFNARRNAPNFGPQELAEAIDYAHLRSARVYLTLNTLIGDDEGDAALDLAAQAYTAGIDGIILQDVGLADVLHARLPDLPLHASTQMTIHDEAGLKAAARLGIRRVILPRELSLAEIAVWSALAATLGLETEVFIHGALCIGYSGQCLLSSMIGGRSGNRGECAQPCRLPWQRTGPSTSAKESPSPLISPRDQALLDHLPGLLASGVRSLKIEGRMRSSSYVGQAVVSYRAALDRAAGWADAPGKPWDQQTQTEKRQLLLAFNRGGSFTDRYVSGVRQPGFLSGVHSGSFGLLLGTVTGIDPRQGLLRVMTAPDWPADESPGRGDVLSIRRAGASEETASAPIGTIEQHGRQLLVKGFHPDVLSQLREGDPVYRMNDRRAEQAVLKADRRRTHLAIVCRSEAHQVCLEAVVIDGQGTPSGLAVRVSLPAEPVMALEAARAAQQIAKTGGTPFLADVQVADPVPLTIASLNDLRRSLLDRMADAIVRQARRDLPPGWTGNWTGARTPVDPAPTQDIAAAHGRQPSLAAYYLTLPDKGDIPCGADRYILPILSLSNANAPAIGQAIRAREPQSQVFAWLPAATAGRSARLLATLLDALAAWGFDGLYAGNPGLADLAQPGLIRIADLTANIFNQASLTWYAKSGAAAICPSPELDLSRLQTLRAAALTAGLPLELPLYGRLRLMTSEFCPIGQNLPGCRICADSQADDTNRPDAAKSYALKDRRQQAFPLLTHPRVCTSEIYSPFLLSAAAEAMQLAAAGPTANPFQGIDLRLTFLEETPAERCQLIDLARQLVQTASESDGQSRAADFQILARRVADRLGCPTGHGHYRQGV